MKRIFLILSIVLLLQACGSKQTDTAVAAEGQCLICGSPLQTLSENHSAQCALCGQAFESAIGCIDGHYICDDCHAMGADSVVWYCMLDTCADAVQVFEHIVSMPFCHIHGPEHHIIVGAALLTAYRNAGGQVDLSQALPEMVRRGKQVPGGACGNWGACGAALSAGMMVSIVTSNSPLATEAWHLSNRATAEALMNISEHGGPRCCKRDSYKALQSTTEFVSRELGVDMGRHTITCTRYAQNQQCLGTHCPYHPKAQ